MQRSTQGGRVSSGKVLIGAMDTFLPLSNAGQTVLIDLGAMPVAGDGNQKVKEKLLGLMKQRERGLTMDDLPVQVQRLYGRLLYYDGAQENERPVSKEGLQEFYSLVFHLLPEEEAKHDRDAIEGTFRKLDIGEEGRRVLSEQEVIAALPKIFDPMPDRENRKKH